MQNRAEKQIKPFKTTVNCVFDYIGCYLVISWFDWKIGVSQQTVVRVFYILKDTGIGVFWLHCAAA